MKPTSEMKPTITEREVGMELLNIGLASSADAFSSTIGEKVLINKLKFNYRSNSKHFRFPKLEGKESLVLKSDIKGDIPGISFLVFDALSVDSLGRRALPPSMRDLPDEEIPGMREEMLVELDNILTASVVSQLANYFKTSMYGAVPRKQMMGPVEVESLLKREGRKFRPNVMVSTQFYTATMPVGPSFIWLFQYEFIDAIKKLTSTKGVYALEKTLV